MGGLLVSQSSGAMNDQALSADGATTWPIHPSKFAHRKHGEIVYLCCVPGSSENAACSTLTG